MTSAVRRLQALLAHEGGEVFVVANHEGSGQPNTHYLTGFTGTFSYAIFPRRGMPLLYTDARYLERARKEAPGCRVLLLKDARELAQRLTTFGGKCMFDGDTVSFSLYKRLSDMVGKGRLLSRPGALHLIRSIKEPGEQRSLRDAIRVTERALQATINGVRPGMTERRIAENFELLCREYGAEGLAFPTIVASGVHGSQPHAVPTGKKVRKGELITIDCGARVDGYNADITRTVALGRPSVRLQALYDAVLHAQDAGFSMIRPGVEAREVDGACRRVLREQGLEHYFTHATGHGIGLEVHELPVLSAKSKTVLAEGMVVTCEPGVYIPGVGGIRIEDDLLITKRGMIQLSNGLPRTLIVL